MYRVDIATLIGKSQTFISSGGEDGGGATGKMATKPVTTVQHYISTFLSMKPLDSLRKHRDNPSMCFKAK